MLFVLFVVVVVVVDDNNLEMNSTSRSCFYQGLPSGHIYIQLIHIYYSWFTGYREMQIYM